MTGITTYEHQGYEIVVTGSKVVGFKATVFDPKGDKVFWVLAGEQEKIYEFAIEGVENAIAGKVSD